REHAALIDLALGDVAQYFVVRDSTQLDHALSRRNRPFAGRVGFISLAAGPETSDSAHNATDGQRADSLVTCDRPELAHLPAQLLGPTRIGADLAAARVAAARPENAGLRFITSQGELLESDGRLTTGVYHAETSLLSRKSELRELRHQALDLDCRIADTEVEHVDLRDQAEALERPIFDLQQRINDLVEEVGDIAARVKLHQQRHSGLRDEVDLSQEEIDGLNREIANLEATLVEVTAKAEEAERSALDVQE